MFKNTASQKVYVYAWDSTTGVGKTGDAANLTAYITSDYGSIAALTDTSATEVSLANAKGVYSFDITQAETNANVIIVSGKSSTSNIQVKGLPEALFPVGAPIRRAQALSEFEFLMTDSINHSPATGATVTVTRSIDGGGFSSGTLSAVTEVGSGIYSVDIGAGDLTGTVMTLRCTATGCDDLPITFIIEQ